MIARYCHNLIFAVSVTLVNMENHVMQFLHVFASAGAAFLTRREQTSLACVDRASNDGVRQYLGVTLDICHLKACMCDYRILVRKNAQCKDETKSVYVLGGKQPLSLSTYAKLRCITGTERPTTRTLCFVPSKPSHVWDRSSGAHISPIQRMLNNTSFYTTGVMRNTELAERIANMICDGYDKTDVAVTLVHALVSKHFAIAEALLDKGRLSETQLIAVALIMRDSFRLEEEKRIVNKLSGSCVKNNMQPLLPRAQVTTRNSCFCLVMKHLCLL